MIVSTNDSQSDTDNTNSAAITATTAANRSSALLGLKMDCSAPYKRMRFLFMSAVAIQFAILAGLTIQPIFTLATGTVITLRTSPVDPYDMFRGDYVMLNYDNISVVKTNGHFQTGQGVYLVLQHASGSAVPKGLSDKKPKAEPGCVAIKGTVQSEYPTGHYHCRYGIEKYFVPEGTGRKLENAKHLNVQLAVDRFGNAVIKNVSPDLISSGK